MSRQSEQKRSFFAIANSLFHKSKSEKKRIVEKYRARSEANSRRFASLFALANFALGIYMPDLPDQADHTELDSVSSLLMEIDLNSSNSLFKIVVCT